jgi:serine/threonine protein kinase
LFILTIKKVASALGYLHSHQIIYRDLKSENVLVWSFPTPDRRGSGNPVDIKLADYGVSRVVLPSGTKGFAGTPSFMAPEIIQHNGEEPYTEKVCSFYLRQK